MPPAEQVLKVARAAGLFIVHTREGHRSDLADCPPAKKARGRLKIGIGDPGPMGRILVRGETGHDIVKELAPAPGEPVVDKPGKGAFYATDLLRHSSKIAHIAQLVVCGVTTEVCVNTTVREAQDLGYDCLVLEDCVASYCPELHQAALAMVKAQGGIFGWVSDSRRFLAALGHARWTPSPRIASRGGHRSRQGAARPGLRAVRRASGQPCRVFPQGLPNTSAAFCCSCGSCWFTYSLMGPR